MAQHTVRLDEGEEEENEVTQEAQAGMGGAGQEYYDRKRREVLGGQETDEEHERHICEQRLSRSGFFMLSRCLVSTPGLTSKYPTCNACVRVRIHTHACIHKHTRHRCQKLPCSVHTSTCTSVHDTCLVYAAIHCTMKLLRTIWEC